MNDLLRDIAPGPPMIALQLALLVVIALRLADETSQVTRNHLIIAAGSAFAFALVYRTIDLIQNMQSVRWPAVAFAGAVLLFIAAEQRLVARYGSLWRRMTGRPYTGPDRRRPPTTTEEQPRDEES